MAPSSSKSLQLVHLDDDPFERERVKAALEGNNLGTPIQVTCVSSPEEFRKVVKKKKPDIVLLDIHLDKEGADGIDLASTMDELAPDAVVLMFSTADDAATIGRCLKGGADDFISKQSDKGELSLRIIHSYKLARLKSTAAPQPDSKPTGTSKFTGTTMRTIAKRIPLMIDSAISAVHVMGESGTGKEVVADLFQATLGSRTPFVKVNCGAIAPNLLESELFGHVKGAFTGATSDKKGYFETATGGWIFLDELGTLPPNAQVALLRVLDNQELVKVGSSRAIPIHVRVISATNVNVSKLVDKGDFRRDLWQRLRETEIKLPPLRERPAEIPELVTHFCQTMPGGPYTVSGPAMEVLSAASWREGNIRELRNCLRAMTEMHVNKLLTPLSIPQRVWEELGDKPSEADGDGHFITDKDITLSLAEGTHFEALQDQLLLGLTKLLGAKNGKMSIRALSVAVGVSRSTLSTRLRSLVEKDLVTMDQLGKWVGISEK